MKRGRKPKWTTEKFQELIGMWLSGVPTQEIADHFEITIHGINTVTQRLRKNGVPLPPRKAGHKAGRLNKPWTQEEVETVVRMRNERSQTQDIANALDRTFYGVQAMILKLKEEKVPIVSLGQGQRRLWDAERLRSSVAGRGLKIISR